MSFRPLLTSLLIAAAGAFGQARDELRLCLRHDVKTLDGLLVEDESEESVRVLIGGVLIRVNRSTQRLEPELATSWRLTQGGRQIEFTLRPGVRFSDGTPFTPDDVAYTMQRLVDPKLHSPAADPFRAAGGEVRTVVQGPNRVLVVFPAVIAGVERLFDQVPIQSRNSPKGQVAGLGPFVVAEHKPGSFLRLTRNPYYWKTDEQGRRLPRLASVRLDIQGNRDIEMLRFRRGEIDMISGLDAEGYDSLRAQSPRSVLDLGPSFDNEMLWFNQVRDAPIAPYKKAWFASRAFRRAVSAALNRDDIVRLVYRGHAEPAGGPFSAANRLWFNPKAKARPYSPADALRELEAEGFRMSGGQLRDSQGRPVAFSLVTNASNKPRARIAALLQEDLAKIGVQVSVAPLDFASLIERISRTFAYEACLLGLVNVDPDPNGQMNVWLSSGANHQWNPAQKSPATPWEAEIDGLMRSQAATADPRKRRVCFDRVQEIIADQVPFIYLVTKSALVAVNPQLRGVAPSVLRPQLYWNAEDLSIEGRR